MRFQKDVKTEQTIKLEDDPPTIACSMVGSGVTSNLIGLTVNKPIIKCQIHIR